MEYKILTMSEFASSIKGFCQLYQKCFSAPITQDIVKWRYLDNPLNELLVCVAIDNGKVVANTAATPCVLINNDKKEKSAVSLNLMIDPEYRGRGIFVKIVRKLYEYMESEDYTSILGFPNHISNPTFTAKLGRNTIYEIPTLDLELETLKSKVAYSENISEDNSFSLGYGQFKHATRKLYINKNHEYLKWRYFRDPRNDYINFVITNGANKVKSFLICKEYNEQLNIVDYFFNNLIDMESLVDHAIKFSIDIKKERVTVWSQTGTDEHLYLQRLGFRNNYPITYFSGRLFGTNDGFHEFYDYRNWFINMGDDNVY